MARPQSRFVCQSCAASFARWEGQCRDCGAWNTLVETVVTAAALGRERRASRSGGATPEAGVEPLGGASSATAPRRSVALDEVDRVLGGGLVAGSVLLLGGEPGIGKSTLVLEIAAGLVRAAGGDPPAVLYASGEESAAQLRLRAARLGLDGAPAERIGLLATTGVERVIAAAEAMDAALVIVDSIQTMTSDHLDGPGGSVGQVRESAARLGAFARERGVPVLLVGHVTKDGSLAGPKVLEHLVDVVLTLEGERFGPLRLLRSTKNRHGSIDEIGVLEMTAEGLRPVPDPGRAFLREETTDAPGVAVAATLEGSRPLLVEVQALVAPTRFAGPRRTAAGVDSDRLALLLAVLGRRCGIDLSGHDVYVSLAGGASVGEPALDLAVAVALASSHRDRPVRPGVVAVGEISLLGELRPARGLDRRLREAARLGFEGAVVPRSSRRVDAPGGLRVHAAGTLREALGLVLLPSDGTHGEGSRLQVPVLGSDAP